MHRKKIRLDNYDHSSCGAYFITLCISNKEVILWEGDSSQTAEAPLSYEGKLIDKEIQKISTVY